jgi:DNA-binding transcriptional LysR family regulator
MPLPPPFAQRSHGPAPSFDWTLVRSFLAVLEAGSVLGAARKLGAQQPTLSRHIAELEAQWNVPLFERTGRGVVPTLAALSLAEAARDMQAGAARLERALTGLGEVTSGSVRVSASQVAASYLLPPLIVELQSMEPGIQLEIVASNTLSNLVRREADIAVRMVRPVQDSLVAKKIGDVPIVACAHRSYLERAGVPRQATELFEHRLVGYDKDETILRGFAGLGYRVGKEVFSVRTDDQITYAQSIQAGAGIGFLAHYVVPQLEGVQVVLPSLKVPLLPCWLAVHREIRSNVLVRKVFDFLAKRLPEVIG